MLLESVFDVFLLRVKFTPCRAFFMAYLARLRRQTCFPRFLMSLQKQSRANLVLQINSELKEIAEREKEQEGTHAEGRAMGGEKSRRLKCHPSRDWKCRARSPTHAPLLLWHSLKFRLLSSFTHQLLFDPHQPHGVESGGPSFVAGMKERRLFYTQSAAQRYHFLLRLIS